MDVDVDKRHRSTPPVPLSPEGNQPLRHDVLNLDRLVDHSRSELPLEANGEITVFASGSRQKLAKHPDGSSRTCQTGEAFRQTDAFERSVFVDVLRPDITTPGTLDVHDF